MAAPALTVVIGAGISGLACAYALKRSGQKVMLLEAAARPGGVIQTVAENGFLFELGPQSFSGTETLSSLWDERGLRDELVAAPHAAPRYILAGGRLVPVPLSPGAFLSSPLLSWRSKFSIVSDLFRRSKPAACDTSVAAFVRARFTPELLDRLVGPFVSGIYAGDPERLSLQAAFPSVYEAQQAAGSVIRGSFQTMKRTTATRHSRRPGIYSFRNGNRALVEALASQLGASLVCNVKLDPKIERDGGCFGLKIASAGGMEKLCCERLVLATPAPASADFLTSLAPGARSALAELDYAPLAVVSHGYRSEQLAGELHGFGFLIPRSSQVRTLGTIWNSSLFQDRAPHKHVLLTSFIGGACDAGLLSLSPDEISRIVHRETAEILSIQGEPVVTRITPYRAAIPQYNLGHASRLRIVREAVSQVPGLSLIGNYTQGPAIGACVGQALAVAEGIRIG